MKLAIILPSRGIMFSRTMECVFNNIKGFENVNLYMAHERPLPDCFNEPLKQAIEDDCDMFWFVEEDMYFPNNSLKIMFDEYLKGYRFVTTEYADRRTGKTLVRRNSTGEPIYTGMGCLLTDRKMLEDIGYPYLRTATFWLVDDDYEYKPDIPQKGYGTQDVWLCYNARKQGLKLHIAPIEVGHMNLEKKADDCVNNGVDTIKIVYINNDNPPK